MRGNKTTSRNTEPLTGAPGHGRLNVRASLLVALAIFAQESVWNFYDAQVPASIQHYTSSAALIGLLMGLDNAFGFVLQPLMGHLSDNLRTRFGRRIPFLIIGAPIAAVVFILIPWTTNFPSLIALIFVFGLVVNSFKPVTEALTPDFQPADQRSKANGIAKIATSLTIIVSSLISLLVVDHNLQLAFAIPAVLMVVAAAVVALTIRETSSPGYRAALAQTKTGARSGPSFRQVIAELIRDKDHSRVLMLAVIFITSATWAAMRSQLTPYAIDVLGLTRGQAGSLALPAGVAFIVVALPIAISSDRLGRRFVTKIGLGVFTVGLLVAFTVPTVQSTIIGVIIASIGYAAFSINGVVIMWNLAPSVSMLGAYTGLYAVAATLGLTLGPALLGVLVDATDWRFLMLHAACFAAAALVVLFFVKREVNPNQFTTTDTADTTETAAADAGGTEGPTA